MIDGETGLLCRPCDVASLVDVMQDDGACPPAEREAMGRAGRAFMERDVSKFVEESVWWRGFCITVDQVRGRMHDIEPAERETP